jgi:aspartate/methionine/tyrosine aminotransferase
LAKNVGKIDGYTDFRGDERVRADLALKLSTNRWKLTSEDIVLTMGGSGALFFCIHALTNKGDKILMPKPSFPLMKAFADYLNVEVL